MREFRKTSGRRRLAYAGVALAALGAAAVWAVVAVTPGTTGRAAPSWAPSAREIGGLRTIAAATPAGYTLFTAHGPVRFLAGMDLGATTPGHLPGELAMTAGDYDPWLAEMGALGVRAVRIYTIHPPEHLHRADQARCRRPAPGIQCRQPALTRTRRPPLGGGCGVREPRHRSGRVCF